MRARLGLILVDLRETVAGAIRAAALVTVVCTGIAEVACGNSPAPSTPDGGVREATAEPAWPRGWRFPPQTAYRTAIPSCRRSGHSAFSGAAITIKSATTSLRSGDSSNPLTAASRLRMLGYGG